jgi:LysR family glycine cleavage system transcriptional activator
VAAVRESRSSRSVAIGARPSVAARWLLPRLPDLERSHPHLEVSVIVGEELEGPLGSGLDLSIRMGDRPWPDLHCEFLADDALYPVMSESFWRKSGRPREPEDLVGLRLLHDRDPQATWEQWRREYGPDEFDVREGPRLTSTDLVLRAAAQGQGVALARHRLAVDDLIGGLLHRPFGQRAVHLSKAYWIVRPLHPASRPAIETVVAWLHRQVALQPGA